VLQQAVAEVPTSKDSTFVFGVSRRPGTGSALEISASSDMPTRLGIVLRATDKKAALLFCFRFLSFVGWRD
jgi:hypothetical protein